MRRVFFKILLLFQIVFIPLINSGCKNQSTSSADSNILSSIRGSSINNDQSINKGDENMTSENAASHTSNQNNSKKTSANSNHSSADHPNDGYIAPTRNSGYGSLNASAPFSLTAPSRKPNFSANEIKQQKEAGEKLLQEISLAAQDLSKSRYTIPKGNYGFAVSNMTINDLPSCAVLADIKRPNDKPFTIIADGVTFWFEYENERMPRATRGLHLLDCENITIKNLTLDSYISTTIEGTITKIDTKNNSIDIKLNAGSFSDESKILDMTGGEQRIIPVKANGDAMPSLYNINNTWGPEYLWIDHVAKSGTDKYVLHFKSPELLDTIYTDGWKNAYGSAGQLEVGDGVSYLFGVILAVCVDNSKQITIDGLKCYIPKGGLWENGGYGNHKWVNCDLRPRAGTNQILGTDGFMSQGLRMGSTYDNLTFGLTSDDVINIHGFWSEISEVAGNVVTLKYAPVGIKKGDPVEFYNTAGKLITTLTVTETPEAAYNYNGFLNSSVKFSANPPTGYQHMKIRFPNNECNNWKIKNCNFLGTYQRILVQCGSGTMENNVIYHMGSVISFDSNTAAYEGGFFGDIVVKNNMVINSGIHPGASILKLWFEKSWTANRSSGKFTISGNVFVGSGSYLLDVDNITSVALTGNIIIDPLRYTALAKPSLLGEKVCIHAVNTKALSATNNYLFEQTVYTTGDKFTSAGTVITTFGNKVYTDAKNSMRNATIQAFQNKSLSIASKVKKVFDAAAAFQG